MQSQLTMVRGQRTMMLHRRAIIRTTGEPIRAVAFQEAATENAADSGQTKTDQSVELHVSETSDQIREEEDYDSSVDQDGEDAA